MHTALSQKSQFEIDGYQIIPDFAPASDLQQLRMQASRLLDSFDPAQVPRSIFSTDAQKHIGDDYFLNSGDKICFFFEEGAFDATGQLQRPKHLAINKIGHALHALDPVFREFSLAQRTHELVRPLNYRCPKLVQSMYIFKQPGIGGVVHPHQDSTFLYTTPTSCVGLWIALEDATRDNGCLWVIPQSHRSGLKQRFVRHATPQANGKLTGFVDHDTSANWDEKTFIPLEVEAGTCVMLHGELVHKSDENRSSHSRHAYSLHFIETCGAHFPTDNWLRWCQD